MLTVSDKTFVPFNEEILSCLDNIFMQIQTIPFNLPFLPVLARYIAQKHASISPDFSSILVVFPSERNKIYFREYLLQETEKEGIIPPCLFTIEQLYDYVFEKMGGEKSGFT